MTPQEKQIREIDRRLREVERNIPRTMGRIASSGGSFKIKTVDAFPPIPTEPTIIYLTSDEYSAWFAGPEYTVWSPLNKFTEKSGSAGTD